MPSSKINRRRGLDVDLVNSWPKVNSVAFSGEGRELREKIFNARQRAVLMYADNYTLPEIFKATGVDRQTFYRLLERCVSIHADGRPTGFRGLLYYSHQADRDIDVSKLKERSPKPGNLTALFSRYPAIYFPLKDYALFGKLPGLKKHESCPSVPAIHSVFIKLCEQEQIGYPHYPFNSESLGRPAIRRWLTKIRLINNIDFLKANDPDSAWMVTARAPDSSLIQANHCFKRVECDGHKIDFHCVIELPSPTGMGVVYHKILRIWLIVLIETMSGAILGYSFSFATNYASADIMRALRNSFVPWEKRKLTVSTVDYGENDGLPSGVIDEFAYACFDELHLDNAKAHLSRLSLSYLERTIGAVPVFPPERRPNSHPYVEGFFHLLEECGIHRMIGTTGSSTKDPRRTKKGGDLKYHLTFDLLADLIDLLIARFNGSQGPNSSISRLDSLRRVVTRRTDIIRHIPLDEREKARRFDMYEESRIGNDHKRVVVRFYGATYTNDVLSTAQRLVKRPVLIEADSEDLRTITCTLDDGTSLGVLFAERRWRQTKHGLVTRQAITKLMRTGLFRTASDLPIAFRTHIEAEAKKTKKAAAMLKHLQLERDEKTVFSPLENSPVQHGRVSSEKEMSKNILGREYADAIKILENIRTQYRS